MKNPERLRNSVENYKYNKTFIVLMGAEFIVDLHQYKNKDGWQINDDLEAIIKTQHPTHVRFPDNYLEFGIIYKTVLDVLLRLTASYNFRIRSDESIYKRATLGAPGTLLIGNPQEGYRLNINIPEEKQKE